MARFTRGLHKPKKKQLLLEFVSFVLCETCGDTKNLCLSCGQPPFLCDCPNAEYGECPECPSERLNVEKVPLS